MKAVFYIFSIIIYFAVHFFFITDKQVIPNFQSKIEKDSSVTISISVVGDLMCHSPEYQFAKVDNDSFDFRPFFKAVKPILSKSDFTFGNLETVTAGKENGGYSGYPNFNTPSSFICTLADAGFDLLITSNNHSLDRGEIGVIRTIEQINKFKLSQTGTFLSLSDRDSIRIFNINNIRFAIISYSYGTNGNPIPKGKDYLINLINYNLIKNDIKKAKGQGCELVIVNFHFGEEYFREPVSYQKEVVESTITFGADIIIGGHPHVIQPVNFFRTKNSLMDTGFVAYSMGNFISNQRKRFTDAGMILTLEITKNLKSGLIKISSIKFIPTWVYKGKINGKPQFLVVPSIANKDSLSFLTKSDSLKMMQAFEDTRNILRRYSPNLILGEVLNE